MSEVLTEVGVKGVVRGRILVVEDEVIVRDLLTNVLAEQGYHVDAVETGEAALRALDSQLYDLVLLDLNLPGGMHGLDVLSAAPAVQTDAQFIVMTAFGSVDTAVEAMKLGAFDYINKPFRTEELLLLMDRAREELELRREVAQLRRRTSAGVRRSIVGKTPAVERVFDLIERVAPTRATVLILGETGTGKELVARAIHELSDRARRPFVAVNCSALPETLLESELFGHMKGSFTGAIQNKRGLFEDAAGGTLFLDEVSTVSAAIQVKLLRVLQERKIQRVGGREPISVDFRLICATNRDLGALVESGEFREDLFYRLNVFPIRVPPLRERREDVPLLANYFRMRFAEENGVEAPEIPPETLSRMVAYEWPGNVRELENFIERAIIMHAGARTIPFEPPQSLRLEPGRDLVTRARDERWDLERVEREYILEVLEQAHWHQGAAAEVLGINRRTLYRKLKRYRELGILPELSEVQV
ncbi:MAG: sigma-54-dependent Fis family transcriptional regulator [Gemmatimonadetes bacterium]|nr:sigma-54-dependent Fis family transcriptional regulator [Gemmatimonadota bacterium]